VDLLPADRTRNHLHGSGAVIAPVTDGDCCQRAAAGREQRGVPAEQPFLGQRSCVLSGRIHHQLDNAVDITVGRHETADIEPELSGDRGSDLFGVQLLAFDLAGLDYVFRESAQVSFAAQAKAQTFHLAEQPPLLTGGARKQWREATLVPRHCRPLRSLPEIHAQSPHTVRR